MTRSYRPRLRALGEADCARIHLAVLQILAETGVLVEDDDTRKRLIDAGCRAGDNGYLLFPEALIARIVATVPETMVLFDREGRAAVDTGDPTPRFCPGLNCVDFLDHETGEIRPCTLSDIENVARICQALPNIDMAASLGNPNDLPAEDQALAVVRALATHSAKPLAFTAHDEVEAEKIWNYLADLAGGWAAFSDKPFALDLTGPTSPLRIKAESCRRLRLAARKAVPVVCYPALMPGINGPITLAGALVQSGAEILAGLAIHQLENPGAPVITGSAILPFDMGTVNLAYGSPEYVLAGLAASDYFGDLSIPTWVGAGCTDAQVLDDQAAAEAGFNLMAASAAGTPFIHNLGYLASGKTGSLEMLVLCDELAGMAKRAASGIAVHEDTLAVDLIKKASRNNKYLTEGRHASRHARKEIWMPSLFQRLNPPDWRAKGSPTGRERIREKLKRILASN